MIKGGNYISLFVTVLNPGHNVSPFVPVFKLQRIVARTKHATRRTKPQMLQKYLMFSRENQCLLLSHHVRT